MIKELIMYTVICDCCSKDSNTDTEHSCWEEQDCAVELAVYGGWKEHDNKHYCDDCWSRGDDGELILKTKP